MIDDEYKYFVDSESINCPFCGRRSVVISNITKGTYNPSNDEEADIYFVTCGSCGNVSLHFTKEDFSYGIYHYSGKARAVLKISQDLLDKAGVSTIDELFFAHIPSSKFVLSEDIPPQIRKELSDAEQSHAQNLLTGGSASLRKSIYLLLKNKKSLVKDEQGRTKYPESLQKLKEILPLIDSELIDFLTSLKQLADDQVHEDSWEGFDGKTLKYCCEVLKHVLSDVYVRPAAQKRHRIALSELRSKLDGSKN